MKTTSFQPLARRSLGYLDLAAAISYRPCKVRISGVRAYMFCVAEEDVPYLRRFSPNTRFKKTPLRICSLIDRIIPASRPLAHKMSCQRYSRRLLICEYYRPRRSPAGDGRRPRRSSKRCDLSPKMRRPSGRTTSVASNETVKRGYCSASHLAASSGSEKMRVVIPKLLYTSV